MTINSIQTSTTVSSQGSSQSQATSSNSESNNESSQEVAQESQETSISTRAEKLQKLSQEFFPGGPKTLQITPAFIQRLEEYGFISSQEAEKLNGQVSQLGLGSNSETATNVPHTVDQLEAFAETLTSRLEKDTPTSTLIDLLKEAKVALEKIDNQTSSSSTDYKSLANRIDAFSTSDNANQLTAEEKQGLNILSVTLSLADKLGPAPTNSKQINDYLSILNKG